ncbi:FimD/PapC N-terminal domain-containing protein, partial [Escherichia coli]|nr:FimD/PapC N-terminal domain-containing protein [Escherichia coli]
TFLMGKDASNIDLSRYTEGNPTLPGIYDVSVYVNDQPLDIDVPQAWIMKNYQNYVDPSLWENGINAAMLSYNL